MDFYLTASKLKLTAAEKSAVKAAQARIGEACRCAALFGGDPQQDKINELAAAFKSKPTAELAAAIATETVTQSAMPALAAMFGGIVVALKAEISRDLLPMAGELTSRTIAALDEQLKVAVAGLETIGDLEDSISDLRAKHARQVEIGNYDCAELVEPFRDALSWIVGSFEV